MAQQEKILRIGFAVFSLITSFLFVFYAVNVYSNPGASGWLKTFAYVAGGYGLMNVYILSWAWRCQSAWTRNANLIIACCLFGVVVMDTLRKGLQSSQQLLVLLGLAGILAINWLAIKKLCQKE